MSVLRPAKPSPHRSQLTPVLIQPNLRFFHELFGWEVELARNEAEVAEAKRREARAQGVLDPSALALVADPPRKIMYTWPTFCRDLVSGASARRTLTTSTA